MSTLSTGTLFLFMITLQDISIAFQDGFKSEAAHLAVNNCILSKAIILNSDPVLDLAGFITITQNEATFVAATPFSESATPPPAVHRCHIERWGEVIYLEVIIKGQSWSYSIDPKSGSYLGFSFSDSKLVLKQQNKPFIYD